MKKIFIDDTPLKTGHAARGMGVYTKNLIRSVKKELANNEDLKFSERNYDLVHYPYFDLFFRTLKINKGVKTVVTVPDVIPLLYTKQYPPGLKGKVNFYRQKNELKKADAVITISETSKKDIVRLLGIDKSNIFVTYLAPNFKFKKILKPKNKYKLSEEFVLYVGDVNYNKNLLTLAEACENLKVELVIVGKQAVEQDYDKSHIENQPLLNLQKKHGDSKYIKRLGFLPDQDLNEIWNLATIYCQPSFYEGFGLGVLEAMQAGVPVIAARTQALVEVASKNNALFFDPKSVKDLENKIKLLLADKKLKKELIKKGRLRVKDFSWDKCAKETIEVYKRLLV